MEDKYSIKQMIIFIIIILLTLGIFYGITTIVTKNKKEKVESTEISDEDITIDYDTILVQNIYNQNEESYYVLAAKDDDQNVAGYNNSISEYTKKEDSLKVYNIDLSSAFNKKYLANESNFNSEYPIFGRTTFVKIENKKITEIYESENDIKDALATLSGE